MEKRFTGGPCYDFCHRLHSDEAKLYAEKCSKLQKVFLNPTVGSFLKREVPDKSLLDIGCGAGDWCNQAALYGAKSVDGFDKQEKMVKLAQQATSQFGDTVNIQTGDITNMPYCDSSFDIALSIHVTCMLPMEVLMSHFKELHRVLVPGGKALVLNLSKSAFQDILIDGANETVVQEKIDQILTHFPDQPSQEQIIKALKSLHEVVCVCFECNKNGSLVHVKDVNQLVNGQCVMRKTYISTFPDYYYDDQFLVDQTLAAGLHIDQIENIFTEERRIMHNILNPEAPFHKDIINHPLYLLYYISKPIL